MLHTDLPTSKTLAHKAFSFENLCVVCSFYVQYHVSPPWGSKHMRGEKFVFHDTTTSKMVDCQLFIHVGNYCCSIPAYNPDALRAQHCAQLRIMSPWHS